jgi:serine/threonine-protein kinase
MALVIGIGLFLLLGSKGDGGPGKFTFPGGLIGQAPAAAQTTLVADAKLQPSSSPTTNGPCDNGSASVPEGRICKLFDASENKIIAGDRYTKGMTVFYQTYVQKKVNVPYVVGSQIGDAITALTRAGLGTPTTKAVDNSAAAGTVLSQSISVNTPVAPGTVLTLQVSSGKVKLPDVTGMKAGDAKAKLNGLGFTSVDTSTTTVTTDQSKDGQVASMDPTPGISYPLNTDIHLTIYQYKPAPPTCSSSTPSSPTGTPTGTSTPTGSTSSSLPPCNGPGA